MTIRIAINGFGRIGRNVLRALYENDYRKQMQVVAINDLGDAETNAHLLKYDSVHGRFDGVVSHDAESLTVNGDRIAITAIRNPEDLPWKDYHVDVVFECTGLFTKRDKAAAHLKAGARKVIISAPSPDADAMVVYGVNHHILNAGHDVISNASCTTNCLAPVAKVLNDTFGIEKGLVTTVHSYTNDQNILDLPHKDLRRARAAAMSMIPTTTGAAKAVSLVLPDLKGKLDGMAIRVPTPNVSVVDLVVTLKKNADQAAVNAALKAAAEGELKGILGYEEAPLVSIDFNGNPLSSIVDASCTKAIGDNMVKVLSWYDNECGFSQRVVDLLNLIIQKQ